RFSAHVATRKARLSRPSWISEAAIGRAISRTKMATCSVATATDADDRGTLPGRRLRDRHGLSRDGQCVAPVVLRVVRSHGILHGAVAVSTLAGSDANPACLSGGGPGTTAAGRDINRSSAARRWK